MVGVLIQTMPMLLFSVHRHFVLVGGMCQVSLSRGFSSVSYGESSCRALYQSDSAGGSAYVLPLPFPCLFSWNLQGLLPCEPSASVGWVSSCSVDERGVGQITQADLPVAWSCTAPLETKPKPSCCALPSQQWEHFNFSRRILCSSQNANATGNADKWGWFHLADITCLMRWKVVEVSAAWELPSLPQELPAAGPQCHSSERSPAYDWQRTLSSERAQQL